MYRRSRALVLSACCLLLVARNTVAGQQPAERFEAGIVFSTITKPNAAETNTQPGFGGRLGFSPVKGLSVEGQVVLFPRHCDVCVGENKGRIVEGLFGVKGGFWFQRLGVFGKVRPGFVTFTKGRLVGSTSSSPPAIDFRSEKTLTNFALDLGGGLEFRVSRRVILRVEAGDLTIRYRMQEASASLGPLTVKVIIPQHTTHNFQFQSGVGFRF